MSKYQVRYDSDKHGTWMVLELVWDNGEGGREWDIVAEYATEAEAQFAAQALRHAEDLEIYAEFG